MVEGRVDLFSAGPGGHQTSEVQFGCFDLLGQKKLPSRGQLPIAMLNICVPGLPASENVTGTALPTAAFGTVMLN